MFRVSVKLPVWYSTDVCRGNKLLDLLVVRVVNQRCEGIPVVRAHEWLLFQKAPMRWIRPGWTYLWLFADGLHKNIMTKRTMENKNLQKASSTHSSIQSFQHRQIRMSTNLIILHCDNMLSYTHQLAVCKPELLCCPGHKNDGCWRRNGPNMRLRFCVIIIKNGVKSQISHFSYDKHSKPCLYVELTCHITRLWVWLKLCNLPRTANIRVFVKCL